MQTVLMQVRADANSTDAVRADANNTDAVRAHVLTTMSAMAPLYGTRH